MRMLETELSSAKQILDPGTILLSDGALVVVLKTGAIEFLELQRPGGKMLPVAEFIRGYQIEENDLFLGQESKSLVG